MSKRLLRTVALLLGVLLLCPLFTFFTVGAEEDPGDRRFLFESLSGGDWQQNGDGTLTLSVSDEAQTLRTVQPAPIGAGASSNALYISLLNESDRTLYLTVRYKCSEDHDVQEVEFAFAPSAQKQTAWKYAPHIAEFKADGEMELILQLDGASAVENEILLYSFYDISVYDPAEDAITSSVVAEIEQCYYEPGASPEEGTIRISGTVPSIFEDDDSSLALFAFGPDDQDSSNVITKTPVARMAISKSFSFSISARSADEIYTRYAVAVVTKEGERRLLCRPIYPDIHTGEVQNNTGFKGFHTGSIYTVLDSGADVEIVDVYLDRLLLSSSDSGDNILYAGDRSYYFFSEAEITALDHRIRNLTGNGCEVYLRFLVSPEATGLSYVNQVDSQIGVVNMGVDIKSEAALLEVHALTDFLTSRYHGGDKGTVTGIILGRAADRSSTYANIGAQGLAAYTEKYATYLNLVAGSARSNIPGLRIVVPISDRAHTDTVTFDDLSGEYFADLFLESLLLTMESLMLTPPAFTAMLEAREGAAVKDPDDTDSLYAFIDSVKARAAAHRFLDDKILYAWDPSMQYSSNALQAAYAIRYTALFFNDSVRSFIVDLSLNPSAQSIAQQLKHLLSKIDTAQGSALLEELKLTYGNAFSQYNAAALVVKQVDKLNVSLSGYQNGRIPTGSYTLFDFSQSGNRNEWYAGSSCNGVSVIDRALTAQMIADGADDYAGIAYAFGSPKNYSVAPLMRFEVGIPKTVTNTGTLYEVQIRLIGVGRTVQASAVITPGSTQMLHLDLGGYTKSLEQLNSIRILVRPLDGNTAPYELCLHTVTLESTTLNSTELAEQIAIHISDAGSGEEIINEQDHTVPILITSAVVFFSLTLITVIAIRHRRAKRRNKQ